MVVGRRRYKRLKSRQRGGAAGGAAGGGSGGSIFRRHELPWPNVSPLWAASWALEGAIGGFKVYSLLFLLLLFLFVVLRCAVCVRSVCVRRWSYVSADAQVTVGADISEWLTLDKRG